jgi:hypothetical protein
MTVLICCALDEGPSVGPMTAEAVAADGCSDGSSCVFNVVPDGSPVGVTFGAGASVIGPDEGISLFSPESDMTTQGPSIAFETIQYRQEVFNLILRRRSEQRVYIRTVETVEFSNKEVLRVGGKAEQGQCRRGTTASCRGPNANAGISAPERGSSLERELHDDRL